MNFKWLQGHSRKEFLDIHASIECGFTLKRILDMIITYSQMLRTHNYSKHSSISWPVWLNGWVFVCNLSGCGFESCCSHLNLWIHSERLRGHDNNIHSKSNLIFCCMSWQENYLRLVSWQNNDNNNVKFQGDTSKNKKYQSMRFCTEALTFLYSILNAVKCY